MFYYLYMIVDVWSRKIVAAEVFAEESMHHSSRLFTKTCFIHNVLPEALVLHADNGGPMKGATMVATLDKLGVTASFSRPSVSNDNPYSEALFRTMKYRPGYPSKPFESIEGPRHGLTILSCGTTPCTCTARFVLSPLMTAITVGRNGSWPTAIRFMKMPSAGIRVDGPAKLETGTRFARSG